MLNFILSFMDQKNKFLLIGVAGLLTLAIALGSIFVLGQLSKSRNTNQERAALDSLSKRSDNQAILPSQVVDTNNSSEPSLGQKIYSGSGFAIRYPDSWGVLSCSNSEHLEFDPYGTDIGGVVCDVAVKPITVLVTKQLNCQGETTSLGGAQVVRSKESSDGDINYRWCVSLGGKNFDITHRVSQTGVRATSKDDFSSKIEELISNIQLSQGS